MCALGLMLVWIIAAVEERIRLRKIKTAATTERSITQKE